SSSEHRYLRIISIELTLALNRTTQMARTSPSWTESGSRLPVAKVNSGRSAWKENPKSGGNATLELVASCCNWAMVWLSAAVKSWLVTLATSGMGGMRWKYLRHLP